MTSTLSVSLFIGHYLMYISCIFRIDNFEYRATPAPSFSLFSFSFYLSRPKADLVFFLAASVAP